MYSDPEPPGIPSEVAAAFAVFPERVRRQLWEVRRLIFSTAAETEGVGPLTETLKWGEPSYITQASGSGSTIRLGWVKSSGDVGAVLFHCRTRLVTTFRARYSETLVFQGNRAILLNSSAPLPVAPLSACLAIALTYRRRGETERRHC